MSSFLGWLLGPRDHAKPVPDKSGEYDRHSEAAAIRRNLADLFDLPFDLLCAEEARLEALVRRGNLEGRVRLAQVRYVRQYREVHEPQAYQFGGGNAVAQAPAAPQQAAPVINIHITGGGGYSVSAVEGGGRVTQGAGRVDAIENASGGDHQTEAVAAALMRQLGPMLAQAIGNRQAAPLQISATEPQRVIAAPQRRAVALVRKQ
jgi:hypothetical protein